MFKNAILYRYEGTLLLPHVLEAALASAAFVSCGATQDTSDGWVPPREEKNGALLEVVGGQWIVMLQVEERSVPSAVIKREVDARADAIEKDTGRRPRGKRVKELKEEVLHTLMPRAFSRLSTIRAWIDPTSRLVVVDAGSLKRADRLIGRLVEAMPGAKVMLANTEITPTSAMASWLFDREGPAGFTIDRECELKQPDSEKAAVRYQHHALDIDEVGEHVRQGKLPTRLALTYEGRVYFVLTDNSAVQLRRVALLDVALEDSGLEEAAEVEAFDANVALVTGELRNLLGALTGALGGISEPAAAAEPVAHVEGDGPDPLYEQACAVVVAQRRASISLVQRHLRVGYNRAARLLARMEADGKVRPMNRDGTRELVAAA